MKGIHVIVMVLAFYLSGLVTEAQQLMLVENKRNLKNFKYYPGEDIRLKVRPDHRIIEGEITCLKDSTMCIGDWEEVSYHDIRFIYRSRQMIRIARSVFLISGVAYFSIDSFNRLINNDSPVILAETALISGGLLGTSILLTPLRYKRLKPEKWRIKMLNFDDFKMGPD